MDIILFYNFISLIWLIGIVEVVSTCSRQPKLITCSKNDNNNYNVPFLHVFNWKSNKHKHKQNKVTVKSEIKNISPKTILFILMMLLNKKYLG